MTLKDKYGLPEATYQAMLKDGFITSKLDRAERILSCYKQKKSSGLSHTESVKGTADEMGCSEQWVYELIRKFK
jgi:hypothetical protein